MGKITIAMDRSSRDRNSIEVSNRLFQEIEGNDRACSESRQFFDVNGIFNCLHFDRQSIWLWVLLVLPGFMTCRQAGAIDAFAVQQSIDRGVAYLKKSQNERGGWNEYSGQSCGLSSLCTLALLNSGVVKDDAVMVSALDYLRGFQPEETYSTALQTLVFCQLGAAGDLPRIRRNVQWLVENQQLGDPLKQRGGSWDYGRMRGSGDPSNTQFALLALSAASDRGIQVKPEVFQRSLKYWSVRQLQGGWGYGNSRRLSGSMTCAGIASTMIAQRCIAASGELTIDCCGGDWDEAQPVEEGLRWLGENFTLQVNPGGDSLTFFYYLYALERVGRLTGRRLIGGHDWYREGAERLLALQDEFVGFWSGSGLMEQNRDIATAFALLFLSKGKRQVVLARARYGDDLTSQQWQQHPNALRQLVRHIERDWGRDLTWQTIDVDSAKLDDLLQAPIVIFSGSEPFQLSPDAERRLREYIDQGGSLIFEAEAGDGCGDAKGFEQSVAQLCNRWFNDLKLERLPPGHPVWTAQHSVDPQFISPDFWIYGIQACCRTAVFYLPQSLSCRWERGDFLFNREFPSGDSNTPNQKAIRQQVLASIQIGENLISYATGRELKDKLAQRMVLEGAAPTEPRRAEIRISALALGAGGEEAKRALPNAVNLVSMGVPIDLTTSNELVGFDSQDLNSVPFLWMHGRTDFELSNNQRETLREYVENGGIVFGSALCGSQAFADAFRREWKQIIPEAEMLRVETQSELLNLGSGFDLRSVSVRRAGSNGKLERTRGPVDLEVIRYDGLAAVFFSPLDLSCALESPNSIQCPGYDTEVAAKIVANLVLFALQQ